jgi:hypothetical protein
MLAKLIDSYLKPSNTEKKMMLLSVMCQNKKGGLNFSQSPYSMIKLRMIFQNQRYLQHPLMESHLFLVEY